MARKIINQQTQTPVSSPLTLTLGGFFTPAKISQSGGLLRVSANAETTRASGFKDLYLPLEFLVAHFGGIPAGMVVTVQVEAADGASTIPVGGIEQAQKRGPDGRAVDYQTGAHGHMVPPGLVRDQYTPQYAPQYTPQYAPQYAPPAPPARITGGRRPMAPVQPPMAPVQPPMAPVQPPMAPVQPPASEASSLTDRVNQLEQSIHALLDAMQVKVKG